jgi:hypothetical protein
MIFSWSLLSKFLESCSRLSMKPHISHRIPFQLQGKSLQLPPGPARLLARWAGKSRAGAPKVFALNIPKLHRSPNGASLIPHLLNLRRQHLSTNPAGAVA